jgi:hypothetical protein
VFSQLGPLFRTHLRQAEKSDTRLEIRRDDPRDQRKKQEFEEPQESAADLWEDSTAVSVEALKAFLVEFLKSRGDDVPEAQDLQAANILQITPEYRAPVNTRTAQAVKAYGAMAAQTLATPPAEAQTEQTTAEADASIDLVSLLAADEVRTMHVLISELDAFSRKGVQTLVIEKADTFLEALVMAVRAEKQKI